MEPARLRCEPGPKGQAVRSMLRRSNSRRIALAVTAMATPSGSPSMPPWLSIQASAMLSTTPSLSVPASESSA